MITLLKKVLLFIASFLVMYFSLFALLFFIKPGGIPFIYRAAQGNIWEGGGTWIKFQKFDPNKKWDVITIGSSHAYRGYDPEVFKEHGMSMYNLGTSNQHTMCTYHIVKTYFTNENCKLLILDLFDKVFSNNDIESKSDLIQNITSDKAALAIAMDAADIRALNMITLRYFNKTIPPLSLDTTGYVNGYLGARKFLDPKKKDTSNLTAKYHTEKSQLKYLRLLLAYCQKEGIKTIVVSHPSPEIYPLQLHSLFLADITPILHQYQVPYYDYTRLKELGSIKYYADPSHLNILGVKKYNEILLKGLAADHIIPNK